MESLYEQIKKLLEELEIYEVQSQINTLARQLVKIVDKWSLQMEVDKKEYKKPERYQLESFEQIKDFVSMLNTKPILNQIKKARSELSNEEIIDTITHLITDDKEIDIHFKRDIDYCNHFKIAVNHLSDEGLFMDRCYICNRYVLPDLDTCIGLEIHPTPPKHPLYWDVVFVCQQCKDDKTLRSKIIYIFGFDVGIRLNKEELRQYLYEKTGSITAHALDTDQEFFMFIQEHNIRELTYEYFKNN